MTIEELIQSIKSRLTEQQTKELIQALETDFSKTLEELKFIPEDPDESFFHRVSLLHKKIELQEMIANSSEYVCIDEIKRLAETLAGFPLPKIKTLLLDLVVNRRETDGEFFFETLIDMLQNELDEEDYLSIVQDPEFKQHLY